MKRIKGQYVATVIIDLDFPADAPDLLDFDDMRKCVVEEITPDLKKWLEEKVDDLGTVRAQQWLAELYEVEEE